jgi:ATP-binding cassette subfamily B protein
MSVKNDAKIKKAAEVACASEFINKQAKKYDTIINQNATNLSGGQKQRLAIARAVAINPDVFVFDDSFSALDFKTDADVRKNISNFNKDAIKIIVAQRIATVMQADQIFLLADGKIIAHGNHKQLFKTNKEYRELVLTQISKKEALHG